MSADNKERARQKKSQGFSIQEKDQANQSEKEPSSFPTIGGEVSRLVVIKNEDDIVRPSNSPYAAASNKDVPEKTGGMSKICAELRRVDSTSPRVIEYDCKH